MLSEFSKFAMLQAVAVAIEHFGPERVKSVPADEIVDELIEYALTNRPDEGAHIMENRAEMVQWCQTVTNMLTGEDQEYIRSQLQDIAGKLEAYDKN